MQAIHTKYLGPTNFRGARIKATAQAGSVTVPWDHALDVAGNHRAAALKLAIRLCWLHDESYAHRWASGGLPDGSYAHVCVGERYINQDAQHS